MDNFKQFCEDDSENLVGMPNGKYGPDSDLYHRYDKGFDKDPTDPHRARRISKKEREQIVSLAKQGMNAQEIGFHIDVPIHVIQGILNLAHKGMNAHEIGFHVDVPIHVIQGIIKLAHQGMNAQEIGFHVDVPIHVIQGILKRQKIGGQTDPNLSIDNLQKDSDVENKMNKRSQWDKPIDIDADPNMAKSVNKDYLNGMRDQMLARYYLGDDYERAIKAYGNVNDPTFQQILKSRKKSMNNGVTQSHVESSIDKIIRDHLKQFSNKNVYNTIMRILHNANKPFKFIWNDIQNVLNAPPKANPGIPFDWDGYYHGRETKKPVTNPYINQPQSLWQKMKRKFES